MSRFANVSRRYLVEAGAKKYAVDFGTASEWSKMFPKAERDALSTEYARTFEHMVENGEYRRLDRTLPKKYRRAG